MITNQTNLFLIFIVNGVIIGLLFDFFRILRKTFKTKDFITYIEDVLFWILIIILYSIFTFNNGEIRLFLFLGIILGIVLYMLLFSKSVIKINVIVINFIKDILIKIFSILLLPFKFIYKLIRKMFFKPISFCIINIRKISTKSFKKIHNNLKSMSKVKNSVKNWKYKKEFLIKCRII